MKAGFDYTISAFDLVGILILIAQISTALSSFFTNRKQNKTFRKYTKTIDKLQNH